MGLKLQYFGHLVRRADSLEKTWVLGDWRQEEKGITEDEVAGWHHWLNGHECEQSLQDSGWQGKLVCCSPWGCKESDTSERLNNNRSQEKHSQDISWSLNGYDHSAIVSSTFFIPPHSLWDKLMMLWIRKDSVFLEWTFFHSVNIYQIPVWVCQALYLLLGDCDEITWHGSYHQRAYGLLWWWFPSSFTPRLREKSDSIRTEVKRWDCVSAVDPLHYLALLSVLGLRDQLSHTHDPF